MKAAIIAGVTLSLAGHVAAWGEVGHEAVGYIAMAFLSTKAAAFVKKTVSSTYSYSLGPAAPWADTVKYETAYLWSQPWHYIDALDSPLTGSCSVQQTRDCTSAGCLSSAISNYTQRVVSTTLAATQVQEALYFLDHFIGDIGQPLHIENYEVGGNDIDTICGGEQTELHATWDTGMIETMVDATYSGSTTAWADALIAQIKTGSYESLAASWISCSSTTAPLSRKRTIEDDLNEFLAHPTPELATLKCPIAWATESNAYDCSTVFNYTTGADLCTGAYYTRNIPIIDLQIAKQGYRLAAWLNVLFDGATNLP